MPGQLQGIGGKHIFIWANWQNLPPSDEGILVITFG
jgi:hypothetical protein